MTASTTTHPQPKKTVRPSVGRLLASKYVDLLLCGFTAWVICATFDWVSYWPSLTLFFWVLEWFWCRDRLNPTAGEYCLGIRYLTSSSSQVVADIQVVHAKLRLNGFILAAGVADLTLAFFFFCGWTLMGKAVLLGFGFGPPLSVFYWALAGSAFLIAGGYLLSGSKRALWVVPLVHAWFLVDFSRSYPVWKGLLESDFFYTALVSNELVQVARTQSCSLLLLFGGWSLFVFGVLFFSRKHLIN